MFINSSVPCSENRAVAVFITFLFFLSLIAQVLLERIQGIFFIHFIVLFVALNILYRVDLRTLKYRVAEANLPSPDRCLVVNEHPEPVKPLGRHEWNRCRICGSVLSVLFIVDLVYRVLLVDRVLAVDLFERHLVCR